MAAGPQQELQEIRQALSGIEKKLEADKVQTLVIGGIIAIITATAATVGTCITNRKQEQVKKELTQSVEKLGEMGKQVAQKQMEFYKSATALLTDLDDSFNAVCYLSPTQKAEQKLTDSLDAYRKLLEQTTEEITDGNLRTEMRKYSDFIIGKFSSIKEAGGKIGDKEKEQYYIESRALLDSVKKHLNKVLTSTGSQK